MSSYKLYYFTFKARAEPIRLLFAYKGIKYEDIRFPPNEEWLKFKPQTPFGSMPVLEEDGKMLGGSLVILRYLGEKEGLAGANAWENAQIANIANFVNDFYDEMVKIHFEEDKEKKKELQVKMRNEIIPKFLGKLDGLIEANGGYLFNGRPTWPDFYLYCIFEVFYDFQSEAASYFTNLMKHKTTFESDANIGKWLAERPQADY